MLDWSEPVVLGAGRDVPPDAEESEEELPPARLALPLHGVRNPWLWIELRFTGSPGLPPPRLHKLSILYPERSLMQHLPAIYRASDRRLGQLRGLVALLETGTQALDARINALGRLIDPATVPPDWLDFLGSWLGLPWEAALPEEAKRAMLRSAGALLAARGTRAGITRLVRCLLPRRPVRLLDPATDLAPALLGTACLPAVVLGAARDRPRLGSNAVIGRACLPESVAPGARDLLEPLSGWVRVELSATEAERAALEPVMEHLLVGFVPAGIRIVLRWRPWPSSGIGRRIGEDLRLLATAPAVLGRGAGLGSVTVAAEEPSRLPAGGLATGFRLT
ncbi:phage tail protein [Siccirubricoccus sp. G192]|nr:phage tail protein [Siccirubricoccus sp. G192]MBV1800629.1 hypothetical protein [Siccirubricoccus sp. G192]